MAPRHDVLHLWAPVAELKPENSPDAKPEFLHIELKQNPRRRAHLKAADFKEAVISIFTLQEFYISDKFWGSLLLYGDTLSRKLLPHSHVWGWGLHDEHTDRQWDWFNT